MKRTVITGASGFIGANLTRRLLTDGHEVHLLLRLQHNPWRLEKLLDDLQLHIVDLNDANQLAQVVRDIRADWIFHLAAYGAYSWQTDLAEMIQTNFIGTTNLVNACLSTGFEAFVNTGSSSEYGFKDHAPSESESLEPNSNYAITKAASTLFCGLAARKHSVHLPTLRLYSVYGPYEEPGRLMPELIRNGLSGQLPTLVNPGVARDYVHVDDVTEAYLSVASRRLAEPGPIFNVGSGIQTSLRDVVEIARKTLGITMAPVWGSMPNRQWDTSVWIADNAKIKRDLGWKCRVNISEGFRKTVEWFRQHPQALEFYEQKASLPT